MSQRQVQASSTPVGEEERALEPVEVLIYVVTGRHGIVTVPEAFCRECDLFIRAVDQGAEQAEADAEVRVLSWWGRVFGALWHGGYHPPVLVVDGQRITQGYQVPTPDEVTQAIEAAAGSRRGHG